MSPGEVCGPLTVPGDLVSEDVEDLRPDLVGEDHGVELSESGETKEDVDDVCREINAALPLLPENEIVELNFHCDKIFPPEHP